MSASESDQIEDAYPLTPLQSGMLHHVLSASGPGKFINLLTAEIEGPLTQDAARLAWQALIARHEALRTGFLSEGLDQPMQVVHRQAPLDFQWYEDGNWQTHAKDTAELRFEVSAPSLMQVRIIAQSETRFRLVWALHHLIGDAWSAHLLLGEVLQILNGSHLSVAPAFVTHAEWLDGLDHAQDADFWHGYFAGYTPEPLAPKGEGVGFAQITHELPTELIAKLSDDARDQAVTLSTLLQSGFAQAVGHLTGAHDVMFGLATSGRTSPIPDVEQCAGLFVNTLPVRVELDNPDLVADLEATGRSLRTREHVPQALLAKWCKTPPGQNVVDVVLSLRSQPEILSIGAFSATNVQLQTPTNVPLVVELDPQSGAISALFDREILNGPQVSAFLTSFELALRSANEPAARMAVLAGPALEAEPQDVIARILAQIAAQPDAIALSDGAAQMSYRELHNRAQAIACMLQENNVVPGDLVALVLPRNADMVCALFGAMLAGAAYVPLDAGYPKSYRAAILQDCAPKLVLGTGISGAIDLASVLPGDAFAPAPVPNDAPAYVIYTSGSTGKPKGVEVSRGALAASQAARDQFYSDAPTAFLLTSPFGFDSSVAGIFWSLTSGANLVISGAQAAQDMQALGQTIAALGISHTLMLPSQYQIMLDAVAPSQLASLRLVVVAGETCPRNLPQTHAMRLPECWLANEYGPTEATVWATAELNGPRQAAPMSIGKPIAGMQIFLLGAGGKAVATGDEGEIVLAGPSLATGYLNRGLETDRAFPQIDLGDGTQTRVYRTGDRGRINADGRINYLGRSDDQVKIRGHRIELAEVETAIAAFDNVRNVAVRPVPAQGAILALQAHVETDAEAQTIQSQLAACLPEHLLPETIVTAEALPRLPNGKLDRGLLTDAPVPNVLPEPAPNADTEPDLVAPVGEPKQQMFIINGTREMLELLNDRLVVPRSFHLLSMEAERDSFGKNASIGVIALGFVQRIRAIQPHGPYRLGGVSMGAVMSYEIAQQLVANGESVRELVLIDPPENPALFTSSFSKNHAFDGHKEDRLSLRSRIASACGATLIGLGKFAGFKAWVSKATYLKAAQKYKIRPPVVAPVILRRHIPVETSLWAYSNHVSALHQIQCTEHDLLHDETTLRQWTDLLAQSLERTKT